MDPQPRQISVEKVLSIVGQKEVELIDLREVLQAQMQRTMHLQGLVDAHQSTISRYEALLAEHGIDATPPEPAEAAKVEPRLAPAPRAIAKKKAA